MEFLVENWEAITAGALVFIASVDKVGLVALKTVRNLMDAWNETFRRPKPLEPPKADTK